MRVAPAVSDDPDTADKFIERRLRKYHIGILVLSAVTVVFFVWAIAATTIDWASSAASDGLHVTLQTTARRFDKAAVASDSELCSEIARNVIMEGGNAVEAAISAVFCNGVVNPYATGIGGGGFFVLYRKEQKKCVFINSRETAPAAATQNMFVADKASAQLGVWKVSTKRLPYSFPTPPAYLKPSGSLPEVLPWSRLVQPSAVLARGYPCTQAAADYFDRIANLDENPAVGPIKKLFTNPLTGDYYKTGDIIVNKALAKTLETIADAENPVELFYKGEFAKELVMEMEMNGGIITADDLANYQSDVTETLYSEIGGLKMCGPPPPSSWAITQLVPKIIEELYIGKQIFNDAEFYHQLIEAQKIAFGLRGQLGDARFSDYSLQLARNLTLRTFAKQLRKKVQDVSQESSYYAASGPVPNDFGTSHISVVDDDGDAVATTSTINMAFGSKILSPLGFIWNNQMDDFSTPGLTNHWGFQPTEANYIKPGRRPMSSMSPTIIFHPDSGEVKMVTGASGGSKIISAVAQTITRGALLYQNAAEIVSAARVHNQLSPYDTEIERGFLKSIIETLEEQYKQKIDLTEEPLGVSHVITRNDDGSWTAAVDARRKTNSGPAGW
ncbi:unnamed protein product [Caenorhabditis auriculariae]|uniref:Gamma-glutamyltransferase n=1 Tax=Caenorhabditis auriculariae TaxID=2777116 RepID=A0A8S1H9I8_9PELO|nr:unnamed protein product [Caenorhabditis auriculariae]